MATAVRQVSDSATGEEAEILTDDQIDRLLQDAEDRLRQKAGLEVAIPASNKIETNHRIPKLQHNLGHKSYIKEHNGVAKADPGLLISKEQKSMAEQLRNTDNKPGSKRANDVTTSGPQWFNLPKTELTPALKRDLQLIEMRSVLDPHRHYKKNTRRGQVPTFSQVGTVIEGAAEWYSGRLNRKDRSKTFVEEAMKTERDNGRFKRKYNEIQDAKTSGKRAHYKKLMSKRQKKS